jgi:hypothetical protein
LLTLEFTEFEFAGKRGRLLALARGIRSAGAPLKVEPVSPEDPVLPGVVSIGARGKSVRIPDGAEIVWRTVNPR